MRHLVVLDNEALGALASVEHRKHRRAIALAQVVTSRKRRAPTTALVAPTAVRVEAGIDRRTPGAALIGALRIQDASLDRAAADLAASIRADTGVAVADAHIGAVVAAMDADRITVVTSDPDDISRAAGVCAITIVRL